MSDLISVYFEDDDGNRISFDNTYLAERTIGSPEPQTYTVEIPGRDGLLDLTESLDGYIHYNNREVELLFKFIDTSGDIDRDAFYASVYKQIHGKKLKVWFSDYGQEDFYLYGRCSVEEIEFTHDNPWGFYFTVTMDCEPWWYDAEETEIECDLTDYEDYKTIYLSDTWDREDLKGRNHYSYYCGTADGTSEPCHPYYFLQFHYSHSFDVYTTLEIWDTEGNDIMYLPKNENSGWYMVSEGYWNIGQGTTYPDNAVVTCDGADSITRQKNSGDEIVYDKIYKVKLNVVLQTGIDSWYLSAAVRDCASVDLPSADNHPSPEIWCPLNHTIVSNGKEWWELADGWNTCDGLYIPASSDEETTLYFSEGDEMTEGSDFDDLDEDESSAIIVYRGGRL